MKTEDFLAQLLGMTETKVSNHNMPPIGFVHYNKLDRIEKPVQQQINSLLVEPATVALFDALREWFEFEATYLKVRSKLSESCILKRSSFRATQN